MRYLILLALALAACAPSAPQSTFMIRTAKGQTVEQGKIDDAQCRNQARAIVGPGMGPRLYQEAHVDCMLGKGYELDRGQR